MFVVSIIIYTRVKKTGKYIYCINCKSSITGVEVLFAPQFTQTINRLLIDCWGRLIDYKLSPMGPALQPIPTNTTNNYHGCNKLYHLKEPTFPLRCKTFHYVVRRSTTLCDVTLRCKTLRYVERCHTTLKDVTLRWKTLCYIVRRYTTL